MTRDEAIEALAAKWREDSYDTSIGIRERCMARDHSKALAALLSQPEEPASCDVCGPFVSVPMCSKCGRLNLSREDLKALDAAAPQPEEEPRACDQADDLHSKWQAEAYDAGRERGREEAAKPEEEPGAEVERCSTPRCLGQKGHSGDCNPLPPPARDFGTALCAHEYDPECPTCVTDTKETAIHDAAYWKGHDKAVEKAAKLVESMVGPPPTGIDTADLHRRGSLARAAQAIRSLAEAKRGSGG